MDCVNLKERLGWQYRVGYEESYHADRGAGARAADPWLMVTRTDSAEGVSGIRTVLGTGFPAGKPSGLLGFHAALG
jgi:hypothetical protein